MRKSELAEVCPRERGREINGVHCIYMRCTYNTCKSRGFMHRNMGLLRLVNEDRECILHICILG